MSTKATLESYTFNYYVRVPIFLMNIKLKENRTLKSSLSYLKEHLK